MTPEQNAHVKTLSGDQEIFDYVIKHLRSQGHRSLESRFGGDCAYRGDGGRMCAVGCLLADDEYTPDMEGKGVYRIEIPVRLHSHKFMLGALQHFHDTSKYWCSERGGFSQLGEKQLEYIRDQFGLKQPEA